jgi:hypothetical protein
LTGSAFGPSGRALGSGPFDEDNSWHGNGSWDDEKAVQGNGKGKERQRDRERTDDEIWRGFKFHVPGFHDEVFWECKSMGIIVQGMISEPLIALGINRAGGGGKNADSTRERCDNSGRDADSQAVRIQHAGVYHSFVVKLGLAGGSLRRQELMYCVG